MEFKENQIFEMKNVLSFRGKITQKILIDKRTEIDKLIKEFGAHAVHPPVTASFGVDHSSGEPVMDLEILIPLDKDVSHEVLVKQIPGYRFKPLFRITNAVMLHNTGAGISIEESIKKLYSYISSRNMRPLTSLYNITFNDPDDPKDLIVDLIIGIDPNII